MNARKWLILVLLLLLAYLGWKYLWPRDRGQAEARRGSDPSLVLDRVWIDNMPERYTDYVHAMLVLSDAPVGLFQKASAYQANIEIMEFRREGGTLKIHYPQNGKSETVRFKISRCNDLPPLDLCLDFAKGPWHGPKRYYGASDDSHLPGTVRTLEAAARERLDAAAH